MAVPEEKLALERQRMVDKQLRKRGISAPAVLEAFSRIPRERFIPPQRVADAYSDFPVPIGWEQTISQPYIVALMVEQLAVSDEHRVLDVGLGSGYQAAILASLAGHVHAIERIAELAERAADTLASMNIANVTVSVGDGSLGLPAEAPFDRIICGAGARSIPQPWVDQLADGGRIVAPVGEQDRQTLVVVDKRGTRIDRREICPVRFVKLIGKHGWRQ